MNIDFSVDNILRPLALIRAFFYLYATVESIFLAYLYWNAYKKYKTTPIIKAVQVLFLAIGINFFYMTIIGLVGLLNRNDILYDILISIVPVFLLPLIYAIVNFRRRSTEEVSKNGEHLVKSYKFKKK